MTVLLLVLAHFIADFWLQTDAMVNNKLKSLKKHLLHHIIVTGFALLISWTALYDFTDPIRYVVLPLLFIVGTHCIIDLLKMKLIDTIKATDSNSLKKLWFFLADQVLHIGMIGIAALLFFRLTSTTVQTSLLKLIEGHGMISFGWGHTMLAFTILFILATSVSGHIVKLVVGSLPSNFANFEGEFTLNHQVKETNASPSKRESHFTEQYHYLTYSNLLPSRGKLIGYVERLLVIFLTMVGAYPSIAFIIAAKSIARFKQLDDRNWAEYFLLGTLTSILLGLLLGLIAKMLFLS